MKTINTLTIFITLGLTLLITLFLSTVPVHAAQLQKAQFEKVEYVNKTNLSEQASQAISKSMAELQIVIAQNRVIPSKVILIPAQLAKTINQPSNIKKTLLAE